MKSGDGFVVMSRQPEQLLKKKKKKKKIEKYFLSYGPLWFWAFLHCQQNISKTVGARAMKSGDGFVMMSRQPD